ncbi:Protein of unknown function [Granulicella rosea]|uniref:DUF2442 domain-containing protein n=1 Tax=Granulicella rosea TaxID=474952 RepID=A0A239LGK8_9BACT|nr:DUF2442 domain-containing protein [Granulicella rosea]SNT29611.1 Protein of unknown function [Granulicella rosea]
MVTQQEHDEALERGRELIRNNPGAVRVRFDKELRQVIVELNRGFSITFPPERAQGLENASDEDLSEIEINSSGLGIYFPRIDADLWVPALAKGRFGNDRWEAAWAAAHSQDKAA